MKFFLLIFLLIIGQHQLSSQEGYWQQKVNYDMSVDFDVENHRYEGQSRINYTNNSPDTLIKAYFHLYLNAFQPESMMDVRSRTLPDPDKRIRDRILYLDNSEQGYQKVSMLEMNGKPCGYEHVGTILEVDLPEAILPGQEVEFSLNFSAQVPVQIRRTGRNNKEGIDYSMAQWYPKLCEYDKQGWHANPYIAREFYGVWGDFKVELNIDKDYTVAASGVLQNADQIGHGYKKLSRKEKRKQTSSDKLKWVFLAENVHDFMWAADPDYEHLVKMTDLGTELHYFYYPGTATVNNWQALHNAMNKAEAFMNKRYGKYPYPVYSFIQGGDGGMEYAMGTLITGRRDYSSLVGVSIHEWLHSWYQMVLGTNESLYSWMDEGFTSFASSEVMNYLREENLVPGKVVENPYKEDLLDYALFSQSGLEEPLSIHSDHFSTNTAFSKASYTKGAVFLSQLLHIVGKKAFDRSLKRYFEEWKFKHPEPNDLIRIFEKESEMELDWYKEYMVYSMRTIDYSVDSVYQFETGKTRVVLARKGMMPMPQDIEIKLDTGQKLYLNIPLRIMRGQKHNDIVEFQIIKDWPWTHPEYVIDLPIDKNSIISIILDPMERTADIEPANNNWINESESEG